MSRPADVANAGEARGAAVADNGLYYRRRADQLLDDRLRTVEERLAKLEASLADVRGQLSRWGGALLVIVTLASMFGSYVADAVFRWIGR
jgi:hypothetical protein